MQNPEMARNDEAPVWKIDAERVGQRLDRYLVAVLKDLSRANVQHMIGAGVVLVNGRAGKAGYVLRAGDEVRTLQLTAGAYSGTAKPQYMPLDVVYEDCDLLVVNKAAGMVVHPAPGHSDDTLVNALLAYYPELQSAEGLRPGIVHRLDKETSGLLVIAKNAPTQAALIEQMKQHEVIKRYLALVEGAVALDQGSIDAPIGRDPRHRQQMAITAVASREARTHFRVLERFQSHTLLLLQLETGRTHQIRVHLQAIGHPVVGDPVYGASRGEAREQGRLGLKRQFLHASQLIFAQPRTGAAIDVEAPLPPDLQAMLQQKSSL